MTPTELLNLSLLKLGMSAGIADISEASRQAYTGRQVYDHLLRASLRAFPWPFATKYADLELVQGPAWDATATVQAWSSTATYAVGDIVDLSGTFYYAIASSLNQTPPNVTYWSEDATDYANKDWSYAYRWPDDCLFARRLCPASLTGRSFDPDPIPFRIGRDVNGLLIYTNETEANLEYTTLDCTALFMDDLFTDSFTWRLAGYLAPSLSRDEKMATKCMAMYQMTLNLAATVASREGQQEKAGEAEWIRDR